MNLAADNPSERLRTPVQFLKSVGPQRAEALRRLGLKQASDVLFFFPRSYEDFAAETRIEDLAEGQPASVTGTIEEVELRNTGIGKSVLGVLIRQDSQHLRAVWFNQPFLREKFRRGVCVRVSAAPNKKGSRWEMTHPRTEIVDSSRAQSASALTPIYRLTDGIKQHQMRRIVGEAVEHFTDDVREVFPESYLLRFGLMHIDVALQQIHKPTDQVSLEQARRRFIYQEFLIQQLAMGLSRNQQVMASEARPLPTSARIEARIEKLLPFELTTAQRAAIDEIKADLCKPAPMNRLLQGDVGSGKTVVALAAMLLAVAHGHQAALMAPTEVLAVQHYQTLKELLSKSEVRLGLLTGSLSRSNRLDTLEALAQGKLDLLVGTHAVLGARAQFRDLAIVVIDEQHRFGVRQRAEFRRSGVAPHYLVMTATPIPRTISMTAYGDLDVSVLRDSPQGRQPVHSYWCSPDKRARWWDFFRQKIQQGRQGFVITPLVDEHDGQAIAGAESSFEQLVNDELEAFRVDLVHGQLHSSDKQAALQRFRQGETQILVATSVVEVGIDVPNANLMTIENGERFGLAQLHQLRGRVRRGKFPGYVGVFANPSTEAGRQRLEAFVENTDGFALAEMDFQLRGPGELFGTMQHGNTSFRIADIRRDNQTLETARKDARDLLRNDPNLSAPEMVHILKMIVARYGKTLNLSNVG